MKHLLTMGLLLCTGCYGNIWEIAITGHVFDETETGRLQPAVGDQVDLCWDINTHVEVTDRRAPALSGCERLAVSAGGVIDTELYGIGGAYIESMSIYLYRGEEVILGSLVDEHIYSVSCGSSYVYADDDVFVAGYDDPCRDDLYASLDFHFIFPSP
ncbi:MAG: hypothetical protein ACI8S6_001774 [Myxococcota bacterium]|jgi:hypothetical protein